MLALFSAPINGAADRKSFLQKTEASLHHVISVEKTSTGCRAKVIRLPFGKTRTASGPLAEPLTCVAKATPLYAAVDLKTPRVERGWEQRQRRSPASACICSFRRPRYQHRMFGSRGRATESCLDDGDAGFLLHTGWSLPRPGWPHLLGSQCWLFLAQTRARVGHIGVPRRSVAEQFVAE